MRISESGLAWHIIQPKFVEFEEGSYLEFLDEDGRSFGRLSFAEIQRLGLACTYNFSTLWLPVLNALRDADGMNHAIDSVSFQSEAFKSLDRDIEEKVLR